MNIQNKKNKGFSLIEVVVALFILALTSSATFLVTTMSIRSQIVGQDYTIAVSLAREGLEVTRGLRDTNWLYYSGSKRDSSGDQARDHWNDGFDGVDGDDPGNSYNEIVLGAGHAFTDDDDFTIEKMSNYFVPIWNYASADVNKKYRWHLKFIENRYSSEQYPLKPEYHVYRTNGDSDGLYYQNDTLAGIPLAGGELTKFYRVIEIKYQESYDQGGNCVPNDQDGDGFMDEDPLGDYNGDGLDDDDGDGVDDEDGFHGDCWLNANDNKILVRSKVMWTDINGNALHVDLDTTLTDWFRRENHS